jgi:hypothetical protein
MPSPDIKWQSYQYKRGDAEITVLREIVYLDNRY